MKKMHPSKLANRCLSVNSHQLAGLDPSWNSKFVEFHRSQSIEFLDSLSAAGLAGFSRFMLQRPYKEFWTAQSTNLGNSRFELRTSANGKASMTS